MLSRLTLRAKLLLTIAIPVVAALALAGIRIDSRLAEASESQRVLDQADEIVAIADYVNAVRGENAALFTPGGAAEDVAAARQVRDDAAAVILSGNNNFDDEIVVEFRDLHTRLTEASSSLGDDPAEISERTAAGIADAPPGTDFNNPEDPGIGDHIRTIYARQAISLEVSALLSYDGDVAALHGVAAEVVAINHAIEMLSTEQSTVANQALIPEINESSLTSTVENIRRAEESFEAALNTSDPDMREQLLALQASDEYQTLVGLRQETRATLIGEQISVDVPTYVGLVVQTQTGLNEVRDEVIDATRSAAATVRDDARRSATTTIIVLAALTALLALLIVLLYRSIRRPLRAVTDRSRQVAEVELPGVVSHMRTNPDAELPTIEPIESPSRDEIGELVYAFNEMSGTAMQLAGEQAASRRNVGDMFMNLGRRNQKLLNRLLKDLTQLERTQEDPDTLAALYGIDHLATRMRRNAESLLVLAGAEQARRWKRPISTGDVVRAAVSEVENYERVIIDDDGEYRIHGDFVADLAHLLAELIENALVYSPPTSSVQVITRNSARGFVFAVMDAGVGMSEERLAEANERIAAAASEDETPSTFLGHFVVGRLAARRGFDVALLEGATGGITARVVVPAAALAGSDSEPALPAESAAPDADGVGTPVDNVIELRQPAPRPDTEPVAGLSPTVDLAPQVHDSPEPVAKPDPIADVQPQPIAEGPTEPALRPNVAQPLGGPIVPATSSATAEPSGQIPVSAGVLAEQRSVRDEGPTSKFGVGVRRPGANLPTTSLPHDRRTDVGAGIDAGSPETVRDSLSSFQGGTRRADEDGSGS